MTCQTYPILRPVHPAALCWLQEAAPRSCMALYLSLAHRRLRKTPYSPVVYPGTNRVFYGT